MDIREEQALSDAINLDRDINETKAAIAKLKEKE